MALSKCEVMTLGKITPYFINNIQLENVNFYKYLRIIFENSLYLINILIIFVKKTYIV